MEMKLKVGNDNGNSEQDMLIDRELVMQPNVNAEVQDLRAIKDQNPAAFLNQMEDNIIATIMSPVVRSTAQTYYIGLSALNSGLGINQLDIDFEEKNESPLPIINTLGNLAAHAVKKYYNENKSIPEELTLKVDMATSLPIQEYYRDTLNKLKFRNKFIKGPHRVNLHVGSEMVHVKIEFEKVIVLAEATPVIFSLVYDENGEYRSGDFFAEFEKQYGLEGVTGKDFENLRILHVDTGDGTTEFPVTNGNRADFNFKNGRSLGVGHAIESALTLIREELDLPDLERQDIPRILKDKNHQHYSKVYNLIYPHLEQQALKIMKEVKQELRKANKEIDLILVYGGGSIMLKEFLYDELLKVAEKTNRAKLLYIPEKYAVTMNAVGLSNFVNNEDLFVAVDKRQADLLEELLVEKKEEQNKENLEAIEA